MPDAPRRHVRQSPAALQRLGQRDLVGVLEIAADGQAPGDTRDAHAERPQELGQVERGGLALHVGIGGQDDLVHPARVQARQQLAHLDVVGADAIERRQRAEQHVIASAELAGALHGQQIVRLLHHAQHAVVAPEIRADPAGILVGDVEADAAVDDALLDRDQRRRQLAHLVGGPLEEKEGQPLGRLGSDAGQALERLDQPRHRLRIVRHLSEGRARRHLSPEAGDLEAARQLAELLLHHVA